MAQETVLYQREENIGLITLNRPERLNAINGALLTDLIRQLQQAKADEEAACLILTGAGRAFCAGEDLKETAAGKDFATWIKEIDALQEIQRVILGLGKPLVAAVQGYAVGGGCEFAMSCDLRIAARGAKFGFPETGVGLTVTTAGTKLLTQLVGLGKAKELIFTGDFIEAEEALRLGLVNKVVSEEDLLEEALALARKITERSPLAIKLSRIAVDQGLHSSFEQILELEANHLLICIEAQNQKEYVRKKLAEMKKG